MSDYIKRSEAIAQIAHEYKMATGDDGRWFAHKALEIIPPAEVIPKGSDEAAIAYAEGWKDGEKAAESRIVWCKECKHFNEDNESWCWFPVDAYGGCTYGKRNE